MSNTFQLSPELSSLIGSFKKNTKRVSAHNRAIQSLFPLNIETLLNTPNPLLAIGFPFPTTETSQADQAGPSDPFAPVVIKNKREPRRRPAPKRVPLKYLAMLAEEEAGLVDPVVWEESIRTMRSRWNDYHRTLAPYHGTVPVENWNRVGKKTKARRIQKLLDNAKEEQEWRAGKKSEKKAPSESIDSDPDSATNPRMIINDSSDDDIIVID